MRSPPTRRRSSLVPPQTVKPGTYRAQKPILFAPNVTPDSFDTTNSDDNDSECDDLNSTLFPPSHEPAASTSRRRLKRRDPDHVPRPPNAFMLFRADFVRQKHVPGSIETNHGSLSKIIGTLWRNLPPHEKKRWEQRAKHEKALHAKRYPGYKYKPVHSKSTARKERKQDTPQEEERCEEIAQLLLDGNKGDQLAQKVAMLDKRLGPTPVLPQRGRASMGNNFNMMHDWPRRRSSSVPPPEMVIPVLHLPRRPSSASGFSSFPSATTSMTTYASPMDPPPYLPPVNTSLFNPSYLHSDPFAQPHSQVHQSPFGYETPSPFDCPPPSFYPNSAAPSPAPSSDGGALPVYAPQPIPPNHGMDQMLEPFLTDQQATCLREGTLRFDDLREDQRMFVRQSVQYMRSTDGSFNGTQDFYDPSFGAQMHHQPFTSDPWGGEQDSYAAAFEYGGRRFSLSQVDLSQIIDSMAPDLRNMPIGMSSFSKDPHQGFEFVDPGHLLQKDRYTH